MVEVRDICFSYGKNAPDTLLGVSFDVPDGICTAILGNNGAGKSTLLKCIDRILRPKSGEVIVDGKNVFAMSSNEMAQNVAYVAQNARAVDMSVFDTVLLGRKPYIQWDATRHDREIVANILRRMKLESYALRSVSELSGGEAQRVAIARAYVNHPQILLADEPTGNLDPTTSLGIMEVLDAINRTGTTIVMATHNEEIVNSMRKRVVELHTGKIVRDEQQGSYDSALYFPDAEVESKSHQALGTSDPNAKYRRQNAIDSTNAPDDTVDVEGATRAETVVNAVDVVAAAVHDGQGNDGIARLAKSVHSGRTGRYGEAFASVETTLTWGKGLSLEQMADQEQAEQTERNEQAKTSAENDASETGADEALALSAPPAPPVPPTQTEPPTPPEPPVPPAPSDENPEDTKEHD